MRVVIFGATGMIGAGVLLECLDDSRVESVLAVGRSPTGRKHAKLRELVHSDFLNYGAIRDELVANDACFFCLGVSSAGMSEEAYGRVTYGFTIAAAEVMAAAHPGMTFCFISGAGADSTEKGRFMWARVKGRTENQLLRMPLNVFVFRPGFIQPMRGVRSRTRLYDVLYRLFGPLIPALRRLLPRYVTTSEILGRAMINVAANGYPKRILEAEDINEAGGTARTASR
jgi:uncharacterized protein YbjT (DUF2867 family)